MSLLCAFQGLVVEEGALRRRPGSGALELVALGLVVLGRGLGGQEPEPPGQGRFVPAGEVAGPLKFQALMPVTLLFVFLFRVDSILYSNTGTVACLLTRSAFSSMSRTVLSTLRQISYLPMVSFSLCHVTLEALLRRDRLFNHS